MRTDSKLLEPVAGMSAIFVHGCFRAGVGRGPFIREGQIDSEVKKRRAIMIATSCFTM